jgi:hypothetical protein
MQKYTVRDGDCILSIAKTHGYLWETIWNDPANAELRAQRADPNVLLAGDEVVLPDKGDKEEVRPTDARHRFVVRADLAKFKIRVLVDDKPDRGAPYELKLANGDVRTGSLDFEGFLTEEIPGDIRTGLLTVGPPTDRMSWGLQFGGLDPITTPSGVEQRLKQLGFDAQPDANQRIKAFQHKHRLDETGEVDPKTRSTLRQQYGQ